MQIGNACNAEGLCRTLRDLQLWKELQQSCNGLDMFGHYGLKPSYGVTSGSALKSREC